MEFQTKDGFRQQKAVIKNNKADNTRVNGLL